MFNLQYKFVLFDNMTGI